MQQVYKVGMAEDFNWGKQMHLQNMVLFQSVVTPAPSMLEGKYYKSLATRKAGDTLREYYPVGGLEMSAFCCLIFQPE